MKNIFLLAFIFLTSSVAYGGAPLIWGPSGATLLQNAICWPDATCQSTAGSAPGVAVWGSITGTLSNQTDLQTALNAKLATTFHAAADTYSLFPSVQGIGSTDYYTQYVSPGGSWSLLNLYQSLTYMMLLPSGAISLAGGAVNTNQSVTIANHPTNLGRNTLGVVKVGVQTGDLFDAFDTDATTKLAYVDANGKIGGPNFLANGAVAATNAVVIAKNGHYKSTQTTAPVATVNANAGTGATCSVATSTDSAGSISLTTTAVAGSSGVECDITFNVAYNVAPICSLTPTGANAINLAVIQGVYLTSATTKLSINFATADAVGRAYTWNYQCIETQ